MVSGQLAPLISQRAYAEHRGCALSAVQRAIKDERLLYSLTVDSRGHKKITSLDAADREWTANTRGNAAEHAGPSFDSDDPIDDGIDYAEARRRREIELWRQAKIKRESEELTLAERRGELITIDEARETVIDEYSSLKTKLLGLPTRIAQRIQSLTPDEVMVIDDLVREALEALSDGG